jgi:hypothetical protein
MTNREFIIKKLNQGKTLWRHCKTCCVSYSKCNNGVWQVYHYDGAEFDKCQTIPMQTAINQLLRNFKNITL